MLKFCLFQMEEAMNHNELHMYNELHFFLFRHEVESGSVAGGVAQIAASVEWITGSFSSFKG